MHSSLVDLQYFLHDTWSLGMGPLHGSFWNSPFGVEFRLRDASQEDGPGQ